MGDKGEINKVVATLYLFCVYDFVGMMEITMRKQFYYEHSFYCLVVILLLLLSLYSFCVLCV